MEWTAGPAVDPSEASSIPDRTMPSGPRGNVREYWVCLALSSVTFGVYGHWYHWVMHRGVCDYLGRRVREKPIWVFLALYSGLYVVIGVFVLTAGIGRPQNWPQRIRNRYLPSRFHTADGSGRISGTGR